MKSIKYLFAALAFVGMGATSCSDFGDVNVDPEHPNQQNMDYTFVFSQVQHQALGSDWDVWRNGLIYSGQFVQHVTAIENWSTYNCYAWSDDYSSAYWEALYKGSRGAIRDVQDVLRSWNGKAGYENDYQMARIMRAYLFHRMTDLYGDIPYSEAGQADLTYYPKYDKQKDIYTDLLKELDEAQDALTEGATAYMAKHDLYMNGNVDKWKKFANSLMLRVAMRLTKVAATDADAKQLLQTYIAKATRENGKYLITDAADNVYLNHTDGSSADDSAEPYAKIFGNSDPGIFYLSKTFVDQLKNTSDPRLALIGTVCENPTYNSSNAKYEMGNTDPSVQRGLPNGGYTASQNDERYIGNSKYGDVATEFNSLITKADGTKDVELYRSKYSVANRYTYGNEKSPTMIVTAAETNFLLAEAVVEGYITGDAKAYYEAGVRAAMKQFSAYTSDGAVALYKQYLTDDAIEAYLAANPFASSKEAQLEQLGTQYWIATFCDEYESFANWRRTGYPKLVEERTAAYAQSATNNKTIPRRFTYPSAEEQNNNEHYKEAVSRLSDGNTFTSRMWWDAK